MEKNRSIDALIFNASELERSEFVGYPIFTLRKESDSALIADCRRVIKEMRVECTEVELPGKMEVEVGFAIPFAATNEMLDFLDSRPHLSELYDQLDAWGDSKKVVPLPSDVKVPSYCFNKITKSLKELAEWDKIEDFTPAQYIVLNVPTGETANVKVDFVAKTYVSDKPLEDWLHTALFRAD